MELNITKIISYRDAWETINSNHLDSLDEIIAALSLIQDESEEDISILIKKEIKEKDWNQLRYGSSVFDQGDKRLKTINYVKNRIGLSISKLNLFNIWLFQDAQVILSDNIIDLPILLAPLKSISKNNRTKKSDQFETIHEDLIKLEPLAINYPFLIFGYEFTTQKKDLEIIEVKSNQLETADNIIIERFIEFSPQYYQAGINIISFFGNYIKQQYPDEDVTVSIEQHRNMVRLKIVTNDGKTEIIEKALEEYQMVISGNKQPEDITDNSSLVLELKNELRIAKLRIESQKDIIGFQKSNIEQFFNILGNGLAKPMPVIIDFKPSMHQQTNIVFNQQISTTFGTLSELKELIPAEKNELHEKVLALESALLKIEKEQDPEVVKKSSAMSKFRRFLFDIEDKESGLYNVVDKVNSGVDIIRDLAGKYNSIAQWCGLPQVPHFLTK